MKLNGRIIGVIIGFFIGGPIGVLIGLGIGYLFDSGRAQSWFHHRLQSQTPSSQQRIQSIFFNATFSVMGHLAKSDGHVSEKEIAIARNVMRSMGLNIEAKKRAIAAFNRGKQSDFQLDSTLNELKRSCWYKPSLLRFFLETQIQIAFANGHSISPNAQYVLQRICQHLGVPDFSFTQFEQQYRAQQNYQRYYQRTHSNSSYQSRTQNFSQIDQAYKVLGVSKAATDAEIKKAYRKLMSENHPDRLIAKGVPEEMIKLATEKTQQIRQAYEDICKVRNMT